MSTAESTQPGRGPRIMARELLPILYFVAITLGMTYPLATDLTGSVLRHPLPLRGVDADQGRWNLWWVKEALVERHQNPYLTDRLFYPYRQADNPIPLYYQDLQLFNMVAGLPILLISDAETGPTLAFNLLVLFQIAFNGCSLFWLVRYLTGSTAGGLVAGTIFAFNPLLQYQLHAGQLVLISFGWAIMHLLFMHKYLYARPNEGGGRRRNGVLAALMMIPMSYVNWYLTLFMLMMSALLVAVRIWEAPVRWREVLKSLLLVYLPWVVAVAPLLASTILFGADPDYELVSGLDYEVSLSLSPLDLITITKDWRFDPAPWYPGTLGFSALLLGGVGAALLRRKGKVWYLLIAAGAVLSLGPYLKWGEAATVAESTGIPLPYMLFRSLPFMSIARAPRRFELLAYVGLAVLAGFAVAWLVSRLRQPVARTPLRTVGAWLASLLLLAVPLAELATLPQPVQKVQLSPFFSLLRAEPGDFGILELPVTTHYAKDHQRMLHQTVHEKKILGGYLSRRLPSYYRRYDSPFQGIAEHKPQTEGPDIVPRLSHLGVLDYYNIRYVIFYKDAGHYETEGLKERVEEYVRSLYPDDSGLVQRDEQLDAYSVPSQQGNTRLVWPGEGWYEPETSGGHTWRWSTGRADLHVATKGPLRLKMSFMSATLAGEANLKMLVNGEDVGEARLSPAQQEVEMREVELPAGENTITLVSDGAAVSPEAAGITPGDTRALSFVVRDLRLEWSAP